MTGNTNLTDLRVAEIEKRGAIGSNDDLNSLSSTSGIYRFGNGVSPSNRPSSIQYLYPQDILIVAVDTYNNVTQTLFHHSATVPTDDGVWVRSKINGAWNTWSLELNKLIGFNKDSVLKTFSNNNAWTATADCFVVGAIEYVTSMGNNSAYVTVDGIFTAIVNVANNNCTGAVCIPVKKGQSVQVNSYSYNNIKAYNIKTS